MVLEVSELDLKLQNLNARLTRVENDQRTVKLGIKIHEKRIERLESILQFHGLDPEDDSFFEEAHTEQDPETEESRSDIVRYTLGAVLATALTCVAFAAFAEDALVLNIATGTVFELEEVAGVGYDFTPEGERRALVIEFEDGEKVRLDPDYWSWMFGSVE